MYDPDDHSDAPIASQIMWLLNDMPYGAGVGVNARIVKNDDGTLNEEHLLAWLIELKNVLRKQVTKINADEQELRDLQAQRDAVRAFLGLGE